MIGRFSSNFIKYLAMGLAFALISFLFKSCEVKAFSIDVKPRVCVRDHLGNVDCSSKGEIAKFWDNNYWTTTNYLGSSGSTGPINNLISFQWPDYNLCKGKSILISGYIGGLFGYFDANSAYEIYNNDNQMSCSYSRVDSSRLKFTCSGIGGGDFLVNFNLNNFESRENYQVAISQVVDISCDSSNSDIITNNNNNTQTIIDNQNKNSNEINNSIKDTNDTMKDDNIDTSSSNSFFNNFKSSDHGLTGIVSAPLKIINQFTTTTCKSVNIDFLGAKADLPCGSTLWGREDLKTFVDIYNVIMGGLISYGALKGIFNRVQGFKNPDSSKVEVIDL